MAASSFTVGAARALGGPEWLMERRIAAAERLADVEWPTPAEEIWRYSPVDHFGLDRYRLRPEADRAIVLPEIDAGSVARGVVVGDLRTDGGADAARWFGTCSDASPDAFTLLHDAFVSGGVFISVPPGVAVPEPIVVEHRTSGDGVASFPHTLVVVGEGAEVTVVDRYAAGGVGHLSDAVIELLVGDGAHLRYTSVQEHGPDVWQVALQRAHVGRDGSLQSSAIALGGEYARLRTESLITGQGGESDLLAVYFGDGSQVLDFRTLQDHAAPRTRSDLLFKGAVEDEARSVYSGLIRLRPEATRARAFQTNRNLVLSEGAAAESIPNLEIEANDVQCSHASTVGPIDDDQRYYLESRGVRPEDAERLIVLGFFDDVFDRLPVRSLVNSLRAAVREKVGHLHG
ncbi:MAG TPA: Fe-S cluster assembly protein SufD [Acidimicrobiia bacterium]|nr:Fe-S cluster assembly protein SufD [Acidimicrobiia bacterium]